MPKFHVKKSVRIDAPLDKVYSSVRDFRQWPAWSPWLIAESDCKVTFDDDGKSYAWEGKVVGAGEMEVVREEPPHAIHYKLTFLKPWKSESAVSFLFAAREGGIEATWTMEGSLPFFMFWMKNMMATFIGMDFERGLNMLKDHIETGAVPSKLDIIGLRSIDGFQYVGAKSSCGLDQIGDRMEEDFRKLRAWVDESGIQPSGQPFAIYHKWDPAKDLTEFTSGIPVAQQPSSLPPGFALGEIPSCRVYSIKHTGFYRHLGNVWATCMMRGRSKVFIQNKAIAPFETYENSPCDVPANELVTIVNMPVK